MVENDSTSFIPITVIVKKESRLHLLLNINNAACCCIVREKIPHIILHYQQKPFTKSTSLGCLTEVIKARMIHVVMSDPIRLSLQFKELEFWLSALSQTIQ